MAQVVEEVVLEGGVLVGHDGSAPSAEAVRWAADVAARTGRPLHVLRAWGMMNAPKPPTSTVGYVPPLTDYEAAVLADLERDIERLELPGEVHLHVVHGRAAAELLHCAKNAEVLVVGKRGEGGFRGLGFGSTADQVVRHAPCPVVVVPTHQPHDR